MFYNEAEIIKRISSSVDIGEKEIYELLSNAILFNNITILKYLLEKGLFVYSINDELSVFELCIQRQNFKALELLDMFKSLKNFKKDSSLVIAVMLNLPLRFIKKLIGMVADINALDRENGNAINWALQNKNNEVLELLLENGADPQLKTDFQNNLSFACSDRNIEAVNLLLEYGADINFSEETSALSMALCYNNFYIADLLISKGIELNLKNSDGRTPLYDSAVRKEYYKCDYLINHGADIKAMDKFGISPEMLLSNDELTELLLIDYDGETDENGEVCFPSYEPSYIQKIECVKKSTNKTSVDKNICFYNQNKVLEKIEKDFLTLTSNEIYQLMKDAILFNNNFVLKKLLENNLFVYSIEGELSVFELCIERHNIEAFDILNNYRKLNEFTTDNSLIMAVEYNLDIKVIEKIASSIYDVNLINEYGSTALEEAIKNRNNKVLVYLLKIGANPNSFRCREDYINLASSFMNLEAVSILVENGADTSFVGELSAISMALHYDCFVIADYLISKGFDTNLKDADGRTALFYSVIKKEFFKCQYLIDNGADIKRKDKYGISPEILLKNEPLRAFLYEELYAGLYENWDKSDMEQDFKDRISMFLGQSGEDNPRTVD